MMNRRDVVRELLDMAAKVGHEAGTHDGHRALELEITFEMHEELRRDEKRKAAIATGQRLRTDKSGVEPPSEWKYDPHRNEARLGIWSLPPSQAMEALKDSDSREWTAKPEVTIPAFVEAVRQRVGIVAAVDAALNGMLGLITTNPNNHFDAAAIHIAEQIRVSGGNFNGAPLVPTDAPTRHEVWNPQQTSLSLDHIEDDSLTLREWEQLMNWTTQMLGAAEHLVELRESHPARDAEWGAPQATRSGPLYLD